MHSLLQSFHTSTQLMIFLTLSAIGLVYVLLSWLFGLVGGGGDAHEVDHDHGHQGHDGHDHHGHTTVKVFSPKLISIFLIGFGGGGIIATNYGLGAVAATIIGLISGFAIGGTLYVFFKILYGQQSNSAIIVERAVGSTAQVNVDIPQHGCGEVGLSLNGQYITSLARSRSNVAINRGLTAKVVAVEGSTLVVEPIQHA